MKTKLLCLQWEMKRSAGNPSTSRPLGTTSDATALPDLLSPDVEEQVSIPPKAAVNASTIRLGKLWRSKILRTVTNRLLPQESHPIAHASVRDADTFERFAKIGNPRLGLESPNRSQEPTSWSVSPQKVTTSTTYLDKTEIVRQAEAKRVSILVDKSRGPANQSARELRQNQSETKLLRQQRIKQAKPITRTIPLTENDSSPIGDTSESVDILHSQLFVEAAEEKLDDLKEPQPDAFSSTPLAYSRAASVPRDRERRTLEWSTCRQKSLPNASTGQHSISTFSAKPLEAQSYSRTAQAETPQESELESEGLYDQGLVSSRMHSEHSPTSCGLENRVKKAIEHEVWAEQFAEPLHAPKLESRHTQDSGYLSMDPSDRSFSIRTLSHSLSHQASIQVDKGSSPRMRSALSVDNATRYSDRPTMTSKTSTHCSVFSCPIHAHMPVDSYGILSNDARTLAGHYSDYLETPGTSYQEESELRDLYNCRSCNHNFVCEKRVPSVRIGAQRSRFCCPEAAKNSLVHHSESGFQKAYDVDNESCPYALSGVSLVNAPMSTNPQTSSHALGDQGWNNDTPNCLDPKKHNEANFSYESEFRHDQGIRINPRRVSWPRQVYQQLNCFSKLVSRTNSERSNSSVTLVGSNSSPITVIPSKPLFTKSESLHPSENGHEVRPEGSTNERINGQTNEDVFLMTQYRIPWYMSLKVSWVQKNLSGCRYRATIAGLLVYEVISNKTFGSFEIHPISSYPVTKSKPHTSLPVNTDKNFTVRNLLLFAGFKFEMKLL
ncbi:hypothetical protein CLF_111042 [Clonorchis sinensis]|uniref:Uncharacterized protein n=1 Tax=Clonorchis sinensis TaxID=79923 RepID=G7YLD6_CLOSI|nr:hypothetical protein CLF_111042 [Clonorchis sinensis]